MIFSVMLTLLMTTVPAGNAHMFSDVPEDALSLRDTDMARQHDMKPSTHDTPCQQTAQCKRHNISMLLQKNWEVACVAY